MDIDNRSIHYAEYRSKDLDSVARLWHNVFINTYPDLTSHRDLDGFRQILREHILPESSITLALDKQSLAGFMALKPDFIDQLYIEIEYQGMGIGSTFINMAKQAYPNGLRLFTLASNQRAIRFYQRHGFKITRRGIAPNEGVPDVLMAWQPSPASVW